MEKDLKAILDSSYSHCKHSDDVLAAHFRQINTTAYEALKYIESHPKSGKHWTGEHYKNYHMS